MEDNYLVQDVALAYSCIRPTVPLHAERFSVEHLYLYFVFDVIRKIVFSISNA